MLFKRFPFSVFHVTLVTFKEPFTSVDSLMNPCLTRLAKLLATVGATVRRFVVMQLLMLYQAGFPGKHLRTPGAFEGVPVFVGQLVFLVLSVFILIELLVTFRAAVGHQVWTLTQM